MDAAEVSVTALAWVHVLVWVAVVLGGLFDRRIARFNLYVGLPLVYVAQSLPLHPIEAAKVVAAGPQAAAEAEADDGDADDATRRLAHRMGLSVREYRSRRRTVDRGEARTIVAPLFYRLQADLGDRCVFNPLSPQGLVILGFVINLYAARWHERRG